METTTFVRKIGCALGKLFGVESVTRDATRSHAIAPKDSSPKYNNPPTAVQSSCYSRKATALLSLRGPLVTQYRRSSFDVAVESSPVI